MWIPWDEKTWGAVAKSVMGKKILCVAAWARPDSTSTVRRNANRDACNATERRNAQGTRMCAKHGVNRRGCPRPLLYEHRGSSASNVSKRLLSSLRVRLWKPPPRKAQRRPYGRRRSSSSSRGRSTGTSANRRRNPHVYVLSCQSGGLVRQRSSVRTNNKCGRPQECTQPVLCRPPQYAASRAALPRANTHMPLVVQTWTKFGPIGACMRQN